MSLRADSAIRRRTLVVILGVAACACAHGRAVGPDPVSRSPTTSTSDPVARLIAQADAEITLGLEELNQGHLDRARAALDRAVEIYLTTPGGANSHPRLAEAYRRALETASARETEALAASDTLAEKPSEPTLIDEARELNTDVPPSEETRRTAEAAVEEEANDFPVELNDAVLSCIDLYRGRLHDWMSAALARGGRYLPRIREIFVAEGLPHDLAYVALVESAFKPAAFSRAQARGVWQFVAATGRRYGLEQNWWIDERGDPEKATRAAARYLKDLYQLFGDWNLALAGYNAGEARVQWATRRYRTQDFWQLSRTRAFKRETRNYVPLIHAAIVVAKAPERYGFEVAPEIPPAFEVAPIPDAVDLRVIAECAGTSVQEIQSLNPGLRRLATPARTTFDLKVPEGKGTTILDCLEKLPAAKRVSLKTHVVARGETLSTIGARFGARPADIAAANRLSNPRRLSVGTELIVPVPPRQAEINRAPADPSVPGAIRLTYRIKPGDTLAGIASQYNTTVHALRSWNRLQGSRIAAGDTLTIFTQSRF